MEESGLAITVKNMLLLYLKYVEFEAIFIALRNLFLVS